MSTTKRVTIYLDPKLHRRLQTKAAKTEQSVSGLVNEAVRQKLAEDTADLDTFQQRTAEPSLPFGDVVKDWKRRGKL